MRKRIFPRIIWYLLLYCVVFTFLVMMQFANRGNFSLKIGDMIVNGRYLPSDEISGEDNKETDKKLLDGGASVFFGGLEFRLNSASGHDTGFSITDKDGVRIQILPVNIAVSEYEAVFSLPGGAELAFTSRNSGSEQDSPPELNISGKFPPGISSVDIPFRPQRSSVIRDAGTDMPNISYNGSRYRFNRYLEGLAEGHLVLLPAVPSVSYRAVTEKKEIDPADFIITGAQTPQSYSQALSLWVSRNYDQWSKNMVSDADEDMVIAWCAEAIQQGNYRSAINVIPAKFSTDPQRGWESAVYQFDRRTGIWNRSVKIVSDFEKENAGRISRLLADKKTSIFEEERLIENLAVRGSDQLIDDLLAFADSVNPEDITVYQCAGILECSIDTGKWREKSPNPFEALAEHACRLAADGLAGNRDNVFVFNNERADLAFNLRLGIALCKWGEKSGKPGWMGLGRSLVLSVLSLGDENGSVPVFLTAVKGREFTESRDRISAARLYRLLGYGAYLPHAEPTGIKGIWAWTASSSVTITQNTNQMDIYVRFPVGETHYVMLRNVRPFPLLQIYDINWRNAYDFESYFDSSGWYYFESERTLVLKIKHRVNVEHIKIFYTIPRVEPPPPPPQTDEEQSGETPVQTGDS